MKALVPPVPLLLQEWLRPGSRSDQRTFLVPSDMPNLHELKEGLIGFGFEFLSFSLTEAAWTQAFFPFSDLLRQRGFKGRLKGWKPSQIHRSLWQGWAHGGWGPRQEPLFNNWLAIKDERQIFEREWLTLLPRLITKPTVLFLEGLDRAPPSTFDLLGVLGRAAWQQPFLAVATFDVHNQVISPFWESFRQTAMTKQTLYGQSTTVERPARQVAIKDLFGFEAFKGISAAEAAQIHRTLQDTLHFAQSSILCEAHSFSAQTLKFRGYEAALFNCLRRSAEDGSDPSEAIFQLPGHNLGIKGPADGAKIPGPEVILRRLEQEKNDQHFMRHAYLASARPDALDAFFNHRLEPVMMQHLNEGFAYLRREGFHHMLSASYQSFSNFLLRKGRFDEAMQQVWKGIRIRRRQNDPQELARIYNGAGYNHFFRGDFIQSFHLFWLALQSIQQVQNKVETLLTLTNFALAYLFSAQLERAEELMEGILSLAEQLRVRYIPFHPRRELAMFLAVCARSRGDMTRAQQWVEDMSGGEDLGKPLEPYCELLVREPHISVEFLQSLVNGPVLDPNGEALQFIEKCFLYRVGRQILAREGQLDEVALLMEHERGLWMQNGLVFPGPDPVRDPYSRRLDLRPFFEEALVSEELRVLERRMREISILNGYQRFLLVVPGLAELIPGTADFLTRVFDCHCTVVQQDAHHKPDWSWEQRTILLPVSVGGTVKASLRLVWSDPQLEADDFKESLRILLQLNQSTISAYLFLFNRQELELKTREVEEEKKRAEQALEEIKTAQFQLVQAEKLAALGQLVAGVAHELNSPLGAVKSISEGLEQYAQDLRQVLMKPENPYQAYHKDLLAVLEECRRRPHREVSTREIRQLKRELSTRMGEQPSTDLVTDELAEELAQWGVTIPDLERHPDLVAPSAGPALELYRPYSALATQTGNIIRAVDRADKIVFALKNFTRMEQESHPVAMDLHENVRTVLTLFQHAFKKGIEVVTDFEPLPQLYGYPDELGQVWTNLIQNAVQSMAGQGRLDISIKVEGDQAVVCLSDSGPGIPEAIQDRIFEAFFTTKKSGEGTGLGLGICRNVVEKHQGTIGFTSKPGRTEFSVRLPLHRQEGAT